MYLEYSAANGSTLSSSCSGLGGPMESLTPFLLLYNEIKFGKYGGWGEYILVNGVLELSLLGLSYNTLSRPPTPSIKNVQKNY